MDLIGLGSVELFGLYWIGIHIIIVTATISNQFSCVSPSAIVNHQSPPPPPLFLTLRAAVSLIGVGTVLRLERDAWSMVKWPECKQQMSTPSPPVRPPPPPNSSATIPSCSSKAPQGKTKTPDWRKWPASCPPPRLGEFQAGEVDSVTGGGGEGGYIRAFFRSGRGECGVRFRTFVCCGVYFTWLVLFSCMFRYFPLVLSL